MNELEFKNEFVYMRDREEQLRSMGNDESLSREAANQIKHLKSALSELVSIVEIHQKSTANNFAWAEIDFAKNALKGNK